MRLPLSFDPVSNGEYAPFPKTKREAAAEAVARGIVDANARRTGVGRRDFLKSACGMAACLSAINSVMGCRGGGYTLPREATLDPAAADAALAGREFIFDIQTHHISPGKPWEARNPAMRDFTRILGGGPGGSRYTYVKEMFLDSDTTCAVLSAFPALPEGQPLPDADAAETREIVDTIGRSPRLYVHAFTAPNAGPPAAMLEGMERVATRFRISAWKLFTMWGPDGRGYRLDDEAATGPFFAKARALGVKIICCHKGPGILGLTGGFERPLDMGPAAKRHPDFKFIAYHAGWTPGLAEGPYDPSPESRGINDLIRTATENGLAPGGNLYAELGTTYWNLMKKPEQTAHALGKLLRHLGEDNVLWGSDSIWYGSPQAQIAAFRAFEISPGFQEKYGYPALTPRIKAKILGLNAARVYGIDPKVVRPKIEADPVERLKIAYLPERNPSFRTYGPRTRREVLALFARRGGMPG